MMEVFEKCSRSGHSVIYRWATIAAEWLSIFEQMNPEARYRSDTPALCAFWKKRILI